MARLIEYGFTGISFLFLIRDYEKRIFLPLEGDTILMLKWYF